jgi:hypothetical protein
MAAYLTTITFDVIIAIAQASCAGVFASICWVTRVDHTLQLWTRRRARRARANAPAAAKLRLGLIAGGLGGQGLALVLLSQTAQACDAGRQVPAG